MIYVLSTVFVLGILVLVHEFGHYLAARLAGIRVEKFSLGFGPKIIAREYRGTEWRISWIPLGGYCKMAGMIDESMDEGGATGAPDEFQSKPALHKLSAVIAGPAMNFLLAYVIYVGLALVIGIQQPVDDTSVVGEVRAGDPAEAAGMIAGDRIVAINEEPVDTWAGLTTRIHSRPDQDLLVEWNRDGVRMSATIHTVMRQDLRDDAIVQIGLIGIIPRMEQVAVGTFEAFGIGAAQLSLWTGKVYTTLKMLVTGKESIRNLGGPLMIGKLAGDSASAGIDALLYFMAFLSLNLAFLNLLPVPILDGGHVVMILVEAAIRRPLPIKWKMVILQTGFVLLMALMAFVIYNDIVRIISGAN